MLAETFHRSFPCTQPACSRVCFPPRSLATGFASIPRRDLVVCSTPCECVIRSAARIRTITGCLEFTRDVIGTRRPANRRRFAEPMKPRVDNGPISIMTPTVRARRRGSRQMSRSCAGCAIPRQTLRSGDHCRPQGSCPDRMARSWRPKDFCFHKYYAFPRCGSFCPVSWFTRNTGFTCKTSSV